MGLGKATRAIAIVNNAEPYTSRLVGLEILKKFTKDVQFFFVRKISNFLAKDLHAGFLLFLFGRIFVFFLCFFF